MKKDVLNILNCELYHGSNFDFLTFDESKIKYVGCNGDGFYFTPDIHEAKKYGSITNRYKVNLKNPIYPKCTILSVDNYKRLLNTIDVNDLRNYGWFNDNEKKSFIELKSNEFFNMKDDYRALFDLTITSTGSIREIANKLKGQNINIDGVVSPKFREVVAFYPSQIIKL